jgi:cytochrome b6-f complex iron-sulfur subunit
MKNRPKKETTDQGEVNRRSFLTWLWVGLGFVALAEFAGLVVAYLRGGKPRQGKGAGEAIVEAGPAEKFAVNSVTAFVRGRFYLCRLEDGGFLAVSRKCTHLGCTVPWKDKEKRFACPCHGSAFDIRGEVISPPAPRALDIYPVAIENNIVKVNTGRPVKRSEFRQEQVVYPT